MKIDLIFNILFYITNKKSILNMLLLIKNKFNLYTLYKKKILLK